MAMRSCEFMGDAGKFSVTFPTGIRTSPINRTRNKDYSAAISAMVQLFLSPPCQP